MDLHSYIITSLVFLYNSKLTLLSCGYIWVVSTYKESKADSLTSTVPTVGTDAIVESYLKRNFLYKKIYFINPATKILILTHALCAYVTDCKQYFETGHLVHVIRDSGYIY